MGKRSGNKYGAVKTRYKGRTFDSKAEAAFAYMLDCEHLHWIPQPPVWLGGDLWYRPDFYVVEQHTYIDVKGVETAAFRAVKKLWRGSGRKLRVARHRRGRFEVVEELS